MWKKRLWNFRTAVSTISYALLEEAASVVQLNVVSEHQAHGGLKT
jgi:hypothetical protein